MHFAGDKGVFSWAKDIFLDVTIKIVLNATKCVSTRGEFKLRRTINSQVFSVLQIHRCNELQYTSSLIYVLAQRQGGVGKLYALGKFARLRCAGCIS